MADRKVEKIAENKFVEVCAQCGIWALKMEIPGWRNWPDRQVFIGDGHTFFIEFKREGEEPRKGQLHRHNELRARGYSVYVCVTLQEALDALNAEFGKLL